MVSKILDISNSCDVLDLHVNRLSPPNLDESKPPNPPPPIKGRPFLSDLIPVQLFYSPNQSQLKKVSPDPVFGGFFDVFGGEFVVFLMLFVALLIGSGGLAGFGLRVLLGWWWRTVFEAKD